MTGEHSSEDKLHDKKHSAIQPAEQGLADHQAPHNNIMLQGTGL